MEIVVLGFAVFALVVWRRFIEQAAAIDALTSRITTLELRIGPDVARRVAPSAPPSVSAPLAVERERPPVTLRPRTGSDPMSGTKPVPPPPPSPKPAATAPSRLQAVMGSDPISVAARPVAPGSDPIDESLETR